MAGERSEARSRQAWELARRQHGIVTRGDLSELGFSPAAIEHRLDSGRLHIVHRGVYAVGWPPATREARWMAAVLACGPDAALSHRGAGALWGIAKERRGWTDVSHRGQHERRRAGIRARTRPSLPAGDVVVHLDIPVTAVERTLVDLAGEMRAAALERAVNEADKRDLIGPEELRDALHRFAGEPGVRALRTLLDRHAFRLSDSELEVIFRSLAAGTGLPPPQTKELIDGFEVDFFWPALGLVVETDGLRYHRTPSAQTRDRLRDQTHTARGLTTLRFTHWQVKREAAHVRSVLRRTAAHLQSMR